MTDIEQQLRAAMRMAVDAEEAMPGPLIAAVQRRHRRRTRLLACLAALIIVAVAVPAFLIGRAVEASRAPAAHPPVPARHLPKTLTGLPLPPGTNLQLLVPNPKGWAEWYSTSTGTMTPIAGFPSVLPPDGGGEVVFTRVQGGFVVNGFRMRLACSNACAGPAWNHYFVADGARTATNIGAGLVDGGLGPWPAVVASGHAGAVWLTSYARSSDNVATPAITELVSTMGQALGPRYQLPAGYLPEAGVDGYLLLDPAPKGYVAAPIFLLWDPATHRVVRRIVDAFAAGPDQIAWTQGCRGCRLQILNVATGKNVSTSIPAGPQTIWGYNATFSDDGQLLRFTTPGPQGGSWLPGEARTPGGAVDIISTDSGRLLEVVPVLSNTRWVTVQWLHGGPTVVVADGPARGSDPLTQFGFWQPGDTRLRIATFTPAREAGQFLQSAANLAAG